MKLLLPSLGAIVKRAVRKSWSFVLTWKVGPKP